MSVDNLPMFFYKLYTVDRISTLLKNVTTGVVSRVDVISKATRAIKLSNQGSGVTTGGCDASSSGCCEDLGRSGG